MALNTKEALKRQRFWVSGRKPQSKLVKTTKRQCWAHGTGEHRDGFVGSYVERSFFLALLSLSLVSCCSADGPPYAAVQRVGGACTLTARLTLAALPMASTEALESLYFPGSAYKIPGQGCAWSSLDRVRVCLAQSEWPGRWSAVIGQVCVTVSL